MRPGDLVNIRGPKGNGGRAMAIGIIVRRDDAVGPDGWYLVYVNGTSEVYHKCYLELVV